MISIATGYQIQNSHEYLTSLDEVASRYVPTAGIMRGAQGVGEEKTTNSERLATAAAGTTITTGTVSATVELEDEEEWLTGLQSYIAQVTASSSGGVTSSSSSSSSSSTSKSALPMSGTTQSQQSSSSSSSSSSNVNPSMTTGNIGGTITGTATGTEKDKKMDRKGDKKGSDQLPPLPLPASGSVPAASSVAPSVEGRSTRRSTRTLAGQQATGNSSSTQPKEEVGDFFKNLLLMGTQGAPVSQSSTAVDDGNKK